MNKHESLILDHLKEYYPITQPHLQGDTPWKFLVAVMLSAQCTDARVNLVTPDLFRQWPTVEDMAKADLAEIETAVQSTGFFRNKAKNIQASAKLVCEKFQGQVPASMEELLLLPGVARKTANVVLNGCYGQNVGLAVDTHVLRISWRLGLTTSKDPVQVEKDLMARFPASEWGDINHRMVSFGRDVCKARKPLCLECTMNEFCPKSGV